MWHKKHDPTKFVCRRCKIVQTTQSKKFRNSQSELSKLKLSDPNIRSKISLIAQINNVESAKKISRSLKKYFSDPSAKLKQGKIAKKLWKKQEYRDAISKKIKQKWKDPDYKRSLVEKHQLKEIDNLFHSLSKEEKAIKKYLDFMNISYKMNHSLDIYEFSFFIMDKILVDIDESKDKELFVKHFFPNYKIANSLVSLKNILKQ